MKRWLSGALVGIFAGFGAYLLVSKKEIALPAVETSKPTTNTAQAPAMFSEPAILARVIETTDLEPLLDPPAKEVTGVPFEPETGATPIFQPSSPAAQDRIPPAVEETLCGLKKPKTPVVISADNVNQLHEVAALTRDTLRIQINSRTNELAVLPLLGILGVKQDGSKGEIEFFKMRDLKATRTLALDQRHLNLAFSHDGERLAIANDKNCVTIENLKTEKQLSFDTDNDQPCLAFSPDDRWIATGGYGTEVEMWDVATGKKIRGFESDEEGGLTPLFSPDGKILVVGNRNSYTRLFETSTGKLINVLDKKLTHEICFNPEGTKLAIAYVDGSIGIWDVKTGKLIREEKTAAEELLRINWSPNGELLVAAGLNGKIMIWDARELKPLRELESPESVCFARFSPDGSRLIIAGSAQGSVQRTITAWGVE